MILHVNASSLEYFARFPSIYRVFQTLDRHISPRLYLYEHDCRSAYSYYIDLTRSRSEVNFPNVVSLRLQIPLCTPFTRLSERRRRRAHGSTFFPSSFGLMAFATNSFFST